MTRILILVRHGIAVEREEFSGADFDRPLTPKGKKQVKEVSKVLKKWKYKPDIILTSAAKRCLATAKVVAKELSYKEKNIINIKELYEANNTEYFKQVNSLSDKAQVVYISGHNPGITQFYSLICGSNFPAMDKGATAIISFPKEMSWIAIEKGSGKLLAYTSPKAL